MNGTLLRALKRSTSCDFVQYAEERQVAHLFDLEHHCVVVMPGTEEVPLPALELARRGCDFLLFSGNELRRLLLDAGISYAMTSEQEPQVGLTCLAHREHVTDKTSQLSADFGQILGITSDFVFPEPLSSLRLYRTYFADVAYVVQR